MKKNTVFFLGMLAMALTFGVLLTACSKKAEAQVGGGSANALKASGKESPASAFTYDLSADGKGVVIKKYTKTVSNVVIPAEIEGLPVVEIGDYAFDGESADGPGYGLTSVVIPASVKKIGHLAFRSCKKLTAVTIQGSGVLLDGYTFASCAELVELAFPDGDGVLIPGTNNSHPGYQAFNGCKKLPLAMRSKLNAMGFTDI